MKITTLILSFLLFIFVLVLQTIQANANESREEFSFELPNQDQAVKEFPKKAIGSDGTVTTRVIVFNAKVKRLTDKNGNGFYSKMQWFADIDAEEPIKVWVQVYAKDEGDANYWTGAGMESPVFTIQGYDPEEGLSFDTLFYSGYNKITRDTLIKVYYEDGRLAYEYGPDDDIDLNDNPAESIEYDIKGDPFINPTPTPTPDDGDSPKMIVYVVDTDNNAISGAKAVLKKDGEEIATASSDKKGKFVLKNLETGRYDLRVSKKGYRKKFLIVTIDEDTGTEKVTIKLKRR